MVASHQRPDGDAIGSAMAMALALRAHRQRGHRRHRRASRRCSCSRFPTSPSIRITPEVTEAFDAALIMECSELSRTGVTGLDRSPVMNIDHHPGNTGYGAINWVDESAAACGEMVFTLIEALGAPLTKDVATHVYLAVLTDTGSFHFSHLTPRTYEIARRCVEAGADPQWIARTHYDSNSLARVRIFGAVMNGMVIVDEGRVALLSITRQTMTDLGRHQRRSRRPDQLSADGEGHRSGRVLQGDRRPRLARQPALERQRRHRRHRPRPRRRRPHQRRRLLGHGPARRRATSSSAQLLTEAIRNK